jgi:CPA1 family monovalent cation:H+ antiporter
LHDRRVENFSGDKIKREYVVPGYFYDHTLVGILEESEKTDQHEFVAVGVIHTQEHEEDHDPEGEDGEAVGSFLMLALLLGILTTIVVVRLFPRFPSPLTTLLFGICLALFQRYSGTVRPGSDHFLNLDSEYLIFGLTPVLILGEILKLDVRLAKRLVLQFIFYGIVGGVINTLLTMLVLAQVLPDAYGMEIRMILGALISTADASFAGKILHHAGVPHRLILLVEGEGMANDPALFALLTLGKVLYERVHLTTSRSVPASFLESFAMTSRIVLAGVALGAVLGILTLGMINFTSNRFEEDHKILQIVITLIACYATFFLAEGVFGMSGALSVVSAGWVMAWKMWPKIISEQAMTAFWHSVGFVGESLLYLVCGFYIGYEAFEVQLGSCIGISFAIWGVALGCRFGTLFACWPILNQLGPKLNPKELILWAWCSLKSRIGLALIIEFSLELLSDEHYKDAKLSKRDIIFIIGCIFLISNIVNGLTAGVVAKMLQLDRVTDFEEKLKSVFFRHALFNVLRQNEGLAPYLKHTFHFTVTDEEHEDHHHKHSSDEDEEDSETVDEGQKPPSQTVDWSKASEESVIVAMRSVFLSVLRSLYWEENEANKISIRAVQSLLEATDHSLELVEAKPIQDFYHLMVNLPPRDATHSQYRVIYILTTFAEYHASARAIVDKELLAPMKEIDGEMPEKLLTAWVRVEKESELSEQFARRELSLRFDERLINKFLTLRSLKLAKVERLIEKFASRGLLSDKDSEESHEAFVEDMASIKSTLRAIGDMVGGPVPVEAEKLMINDSMYEIGVKTND